MNFYMIGPLCQASQTVFASTDLQGSRNASIKAGIIAHLRSFGFRFSGSAQVASRPFGCRLSRVAAGKGADHGCFLSVSDICTLKSTYLWRINLGSVLWITKCRQGC